MSKRVYTVLGGKFDQNKFVFKGSSRIFGEGFHVEVIFEAKKMEGRLAFGKDILFYI